MAETLTFHFEGALADTHRMNFYESARFQYAAARLMVKLAQFRSQGTFVQKITSNTNYDINLSSQRDGSFNINIEDNTPKSPGENFIDVSMSDLIAYVSERVVGKIDESSIDNTMLEAYAQSVAGTASTSSSRRPKAVSSSAALDRLVDAYIADAEVASSWPSQIRDLVARRLAETIREQQLALKKNDIAKIDLTRDQKLIAMSAPLISEMATALRKSADTLKIVSTTNSRDSSVLFLDQRMAMEIETAIVDKDITTVLGDISQFNKENGWGKLKIANSIKPVSFSIPSDILPVIKQKLIDSMKKDMVHLQTYYVRDKGKQLTRLIVVGVLPTPAP